MKNLYERKFTPNKDVCIADHKKTDLSETKFNAICVCIRSDSKRESFESSHHAFCWLFSQVSKRFPQNSQSWKFVISNKIANIIF